MNWLTKWFISNPVSANLLMITIIVSGILAMGELRVESFPQTKPSAIVVNVAYPGGTAKQIDEGVTQRIEESISGIAGIKQITSQSSAGLSSVLIKKTSNTSLEYLQNEVRNRVNAISNFPALAEKPQVMRQTFTNLAAFVVISGPKSDDQLQPIARQVELELRKSPLISSVTNWGSRPSQIVIQPDKNKLKQLGMELDDLAAAIGKMSMEYKAGEILNETGRILIRGDGYANDLQALKQLTILSGPTGEVLLGDVSSIKRGYQQSESIVRNNGINAIALLVSTSQSDNLLDISDAISATLDEQRQSLPDDITLTTLANMAPYIEEQLLRLSDSAWQGLLIVLILLGLFLDLKLAFWVAVGIPVAIAGTLGAMQLTNYSINDITLFGFILVLGILVDDAVVVGEAIHEKRHRQADLAKPNNRLAAWKGVQSVSVATIFGVLTTIAAFSPMLWINNELAKVFAGFSAVVIFALTFSLIESKFILPSHLAHTKPLPKYLGGIAQIQHMAQSMLELINQRLYLPTLRLALEYKFAFLLVFIAFLVLAYGMWSTGTIRSTLFPEIPGRYLTVNATLEDGAPKRLQKNAIGKIESSLRRVEHALTEQYSLDEKPVKNLLSWADGFGNIEITAELTSEALNKLPGRILVDRWRTETGPIEGSYSVQFSSGDSPAGETFVSVSSSDRAIAKRVTSELSLSLENIAGVTDVYDDGKGGEPQVKLILNEYGKQLGLTQRSLAQLAGETFGQREAYRILEQGQEIKVLLQYSKEDRINLSQLKQANVMLANEKYVALGDVADLTLQREPQIVYRNNREQVINVYWKQDRSIQSPEETLMQLQSKANELEQLYPNITIRAGGEFEEIQEVSSGFRSAMILTLLLIYVLLAIPLKSYWQPLIIMAAIPFGFAGSIFGHFIMNLPISLLSMFGMMAMTGIVINDSLVLITRFNKEFRSGTPLKLALIQTGKSRFRAIFLTTVTTVCGLLPLLLETSEQAQYLKPAAVSLVFGELFATVVTLLLIPVLLGFSYRNTKHTKQDESSFALKDKAIKNNSSDSWDNKLC